MSGKLAGRVAIVTGSGQGIGGAIAIALGRHGARVVTNNRARGTPGGDAETTAQTIRKEGGEAVPFFGDVSSFEETRKLAQTAVDNFGKVDILVNVAGIGTTGMVWEMPERDWDIVVDVHLKGTYNCTHHAAALMVKQGWGRILNTSSIAWLGTPGRCNYNAAKAGIVGFTRGVAKEVESHGITCNAFVPWVATRLTASPESMALMKRRYEMGFYTKEEYYEFTHMPEPPTVAPLLVYLCTDEAAKINGKVFDIYGGKLSLYSEPVKKRTIVKEKGLWTVEELIEAVPGGLMEGDC